MALAYKQQIRSNATEYSPEINHTYMLIQLLTEEPSMKVKG